jgi:hypothetical protein
VPVINPPLTTNGVVQLNWTAFPSGAYQVQYQDALSNSNWNLLAARVTATNCWAGFTDPVAAGNSRFYRINVLPW